MTQREKQEKTKSKVDILAEMLDKEFTKLGLKIEWGNQTGSFVYFPKRKSPLKDTKGEEEK